jgi:hypothetical protein
LSTWGQVAIAKGTKYLHEVDSFSIISLIDAHIARVVVLEIGYSSAVAMDSGVFGTITH